MSVLACGRYKCKNIMCSRLILDRSMYMCESCYDELVIYKSSLNKGTIITLADVRSMIQYFMGTTPGTFITATPQDVEAEFDRLTNCVITLADIRSAY